MRLVLCRAYAAKESVLGEITMDDVKVTALLPEQRCTIASVAGHAMYERANPFYEHFLGGHIDMRDCRYEQHDERTTRITEPRFVPAADLRVKLEGSGKLGERHVGIVGVRDPYTIAHIDEVIPASPAYRWTINHTLRLDDPLELFPTFVTEAGV